jgi:predicted RNA binding protein YcfA (HicA-like mRNA interferase family)
MPPLGPIKRKVLIYYLQRLDFQGPFSGGNHQFMIKGEITLRIPNPHKSDIGREFLLRILKQAGISRRDWERL